MKKQQLLFIAIVLCSITSCSSLSSDNPENWSEKKLAKWFRAGEWKSGWYVTPDESINPKELARQIFKNKKRWKKAFQFLETNDLKNLSLGRHELDGDSLFVNVDEYITKDEENTRFEAHRKYADIQYLVSGEEKIGVDPLLETEVLVPYDEVKDIVFLKSVKNNYRITNTEKFFVFLPGDAHRPGVKMGDNIRVRKVVVKVRID